MTQNKIALLIIQGAISQLSPEDKAKIDGYADLFRLALQEGGEVAQLALTVVATELAAADE